MSASPESDSVAPTACELADLIAKFPRIRLCGDVEGISRFGEYLLADEDRRMIVTALQVYREVVADGVS